MTLSRDTSSASRELQLAILRGLDGATRLLLACRMSDEAREVSKAGLRHRHPEWTDAQLSEAVRAVLLGPALANEVRGGRPRRT